MFCFIILNKETIRTLDITHLSCNINIVDHRTSIYKNLTIKLNSSFYNLLYSMYIRCECCNNNTSFSFSEFFLYLSCNSLFTNGECRYFSICTITH